MTTFSVVIPTYNRCDYLMACLSTVFAQRRQPDEVIVIDDGSTDGTRAALDAFGDVIVIAQSNAGPGAARNRGAAAASGDYLVFLDSDDLWFPWTLEVYATLVERYERPALIVARADDFSGEPVVPSETPADGWSFLSLLHASVHAFSMGAGMMIVDRRAFLAVGGFAEDRLNAEDHDLALRLSDSTGFVLMLQPTTIARRIHASNETADLQKSIEGLVRLINRERTGEYPGSDKWKGSRRTIIARHIRPVVLQAIRAGELRTAWMLYRRGLVWNARAGRIAFLGAIPLMILHAALRSLIKMGVLAITHSSGKTRFRCDERQ
jgi:GT2 family glycosyltransferase